jgi:hypothetical protein
MEYTYICIFVCVKCLCLWLCSNSIFTVIYSTFLAIISVTVQFTIRYIYAIYTECLCATLKFVYWNPKPQCEGIIKKYDFGGNIGDEVRALTNGVSVPIKGPQRVLSSSFSHVRIQPEVSSLQSRKRPLSEPNPPGTWSWTSIFPNYKK